MRFNRIVILATLLAAPALALAQSTTVGTPDGRASLTLGGHFDPASRGGSLGASGNLGAFGFDNRLEGDPSGGRFVNPPLNGAFGSHGQEYDESFGPPIAHVTVGAGAITAGFDEAGRLTGLSWPGPGFYDHVSFVHVTRGWPNQGAPENAGSFGGLGDEWLTPAFGWMPVSQHYESDTTETVVTELARSETLHVVITDVVDPVEDLVARNFCFRNPLSAAPAACIALAPGTGFAHYADMNPTTGRVPRAPSVTDGAADDFSDFGTVYDDASATMLHFRPYRVDPAALSRLATSKPGRRKAREAVHGGFGPGVYVAIGGQGAAGSFQAGVNSGGLVRDEAEGTGLLDPYYDLADDGALSGSFAAFGKTAGALGDLPADGDGSFTVYLAAAESPERAIDSIQAARQRGFAAIHETSNQSWAEWISRARLPFTTDAAALAVSRHALMLIRTAQDRKTGAIVANATVQTPYRQDWVRDGAFFNYALLLAGYPEMALAHSEFYRRVYRPGGTWDSLYYTDGAEAGLVFPYEIDSQAFALWALWLPYEFGAGDLDYLKRVYPAIRDTADALLLCRDPLNGMQCYAAEDDSVQPTQGAQGASTVYLALSVAAQAAYDLGGHEEQRARWQSRADELQLATLGTLCGSGSCPGGRGGVYLVWPSRLLDGDSALAQDLLDRFAADLDDRAAFVAPLRGGYLQYPMEPILALAPFWHATDPATRETHLTTWTDWLTQKVADQEVFHFGERIYYCDGQPPCAPGHPYLHSIGFPHIWSGTEMYLAAAFTRGITGCPATTSKIGEAACQ